MQKLVPFLPLLALACSLSGNVAKAPIQTYPAAKPTQVVPTQPETCTVTALKALNLRAAAGTSSAVITILEHGQTVTILPHPDEGTWLHVRTADAEGWINTNYCERK
jgi:uncharacterized protein YraI